MADIDLALKELKLNTENQTGAQISAKAGKKRDIFRGAQIKYFVSSIMEEITSSSGGKEKSGKAVFEEVVFICRYIRKTKLRLFKKYQSNNRMNDFKMQKF
jgi:hypothetical protein